MRWLSGKSAGRKETTRAEAARARKSRPPKKALGLRDILIRSGIAVGAVGLLAGGSVTAWKMGYPQQAAAGAWQGALNLSADAGLKLQRITVEGRLRTPRADLFAAIGAKQGDPILGIDIDAARERLESIGWVRTAVVERRLPDLVHIQLAERAPVAIWQNRGHFALVDTDGAVINRSDLGGWSHLPIVVGEGAPARTRELLAMLAGEKLLAERVRAAVLVSGRRWDLHIDDASEGVEIRLPETDPAKAWAWFASLQRDHNILARDVKIVDLRTPDRLVVRLANETVEEKAAPAGGEDT